MRHLIDRLLRARRPGEALDRWELPYPVKRRGQKLGLTFSRRVARARSLKKSRRRSGSCNFQLTLRPLVSVRLNCVSGTRSSALCRRGRLCRWTGARSCFLFASEDEAAAAAASLRSLLHGRQARDEADQRDIRSMFSKQKHKDTLFYLV